MKILTDIGHAKNAHILSAIAPILKKRGHELHFVYRSYDCIPELCRAFGFMGEDRGAGGDGVIGKLRYFKRVSTLMETVARQVKPDLLLSFGSPYLARLSGRTGIPMVVLDDTERNRWVQTAYRRQARVIIVPECFSKELSRNQRRFPGYFELAYLHPRCFTPDPRLVSDALGDDQFVLIRVVAWRALHDLNHSGISTKQLLDLVHAFSSKAKVCISAEDRLPPELEPLRVKTPAHLVHHVLAQASLVFSEGATMAAEAAVLGVPTIHCSDLRPGYLSDLEGRYGLLQSYPRCDLRGALETAGSFLSAGNEIRNEWQKRRERMLAESADVIEFMVKTIEAFDQGGR